MTHSFPTRSAADLDKGGGCQLPCAHGTASRAPRQASARGNAHVHPRRTGPGYVRGSRRAGARGRRAWRRARGVPAGWTGPADAIGDRKEHTSELQSLMRISYAAFCLNNNTVTTMVTTL